MTSSNLVREQGSQDEQDVVDVNNEHVDLGIVATNKKEKSTMRHVMHLLLPRSQEAGYLGFIATQIMPDVAVLKP